MRGVVQDIGGLVKEQGEQLNAVEDHIDETSDKVVRANIDLIQAARYQTSYRRKCAFFWLLVLVLIAVILIPVLLHVIPSAGS